MLSRVGRPVADQVNVVMPGSESVADIVRLTGVPTVPDWLPGLVTLTTLVIVQAKLADPDAPLVPVPVTVTENALPVPAAGAPVITPVGALMDSPVCRPA